jgi:hypothetical protein
MPEAIKNEDGTDKQDCEINAAKRLLPKIRKQPAILSELSCSVCFMISPQKSIFCNILTSIFR